MTWMEPAMGVDQTEELHRQLQLRESKRRDTAVSSASASTFGETLDSDSGSSESYSLELRPPPGLELPVPDTTVTPTVAAMTPGPLPFEGSNPLVEGLRQTVMQMIDLKYQQRAWPDPPYTPPVIHQATSAPERLPQEESQTSTDRWHGADIERPGTQRQEGQQRKGRNERKKQREAREAKNRSGKQNVKGAYNFTVFFNGFDPEQHSDFEMVPRLIGRQGCNMKPIYSTGAMARVWGGDGDMLQLAVSCETEDVMEAARLSVKHLLDGISFHFRRFCCKKQIPCPELYYIK